MGDQALNSTSLAFYYLGVAFVFLLSSGLVSGLAVLTANRFFKKRDDLAGIHDSNQTAVLVAGTEWGKMLLQRVGNLEAEAKNERKEFEKKIEDQKQFFENKLEVQKLNLEQKIDQLQAVVNSQMVEAGRKDEKIAHLEADNDRLRTKLREQEVTIAELRRELDTLKLLVDKNGPSTMIDTGNGPLDVRLVDRGSSDPPDPDSKSTPP